MAKTYFREWRILRGMSQIELARRLGVNRQRVWRIESGKADFTGKYLFDFAEVIGCPKPGDPVNDPPSALTADASPKKPSGSLKADNNS